MVIAPTTYGSLYRIKRTVYNTRIIIALSFIILVSLTLTIIPALSAQTSRISRVEVSKYSNRSQSIDVHKSILSGEAYIFVSDSSAKYIEFRIDGKYIRTEKKVPFDLGATNSDGTARAYNFSTLQEGNHILRVTVVYGFFDFKNIDIPFSTSAKNVIEEGEELTPINNVNNNTLNTVPPVIATSPTTSTSVVTTTVPVPTTSPKKNNANQTNQWVIYASDQDTPNAELFISKVDGTGKRQLTNDPNYSNTWPRVTSDGKTVYFYRIPPNTLSSNYFVYSLWKINTDGTGLKQIYAQGYNGWWLQGHVDISPDDKTLVFAALVPFKGLTMFLADMDGGNLREIPTKTKSPIDPAWTPDGRILFSATPPDAEDKPETVEVYITTRSGDERRLTYDNLRDHDPAMSPDGKHIAILTHSDPTYMYPGKWTQRILDVSTNKITTLIGPDHFSANPRWVDNETTVYGYWDWDKAGWGIKVSRIDGTKSNMLVPAQQHIGFWTAYVGDPFAFNMS